MDIINLDIPGCFLVTPKIISDERGHFVKVYKESDFYRAGIEFKFEEEYYSVSNQGVIRGMHFQVPPHDHCKMVYCPKGAVFDAFVDLRKGSPTYLESRCTQLTEVNGGILILAKGIAHGFCSLEDGTVMVYKTTSEYQPSGDCGVLWDSCGIQWPAIMNAKSLSDRDKSFPALKVFESPFVLK